jgi:alkaline phosphatase D
MGRILIRNEKIKLYMKFLLTIIFGLLFSANLYGQRNKAQSPAQLLSGPMVAHTTSSLATIWIETDFSAEVKVHYWVESGTRPIVRGVAVGLTDRESPHVGIVKLEGLPARGLVHYELEINGRAVRPQTVQSFLLMPAPESIASFKVAFASCMNPIRVPLQPIWTQVAIFRPDALLLIGDNNYMPMRPEAYDAPESTVAYAMARYHRYLRDVPGLRSVLATTPTYAIWDDHDYGPNDSDRTFRWRDLTFDLFKKYWPNPSAGTPETAGIFYSFKISDVEFFMLDDRYHRDPNNAPDRSTMLGTGQLSWLREQLKASTATFKVIVNGHTMSIDRRGTGEYWGNFGNERQNFLEWMFSEGIDGVFFISGDWHVGSLSRVDFSPGEGYPLYELISSNAGVRSVEADDHQYSYNRQTGGHNRRFDGPIINDIQDYNFGLLEFSGGEGNRTVTLKIIDHRGEVRVAHQLTRKDLTNRP